jgi:hypothetical protein
VSILHAYALWGEAVVRNALHEPAPEATSVQLAQEVERRIGTSDTAAFATWALSLPWPRFCAVVRIAVGVEREDLLGRDD